MRGWKQRVLSLLLCMGLLLSMAACAKEEGQERVPTTTPTAAVEPTAATAPEPTQSGLKTPTAAPTAEPTAVPTAAPTVDSKTARPFRSLTAEEMVAEMGTGWNLGNTMDGHTGLTPSETLWQSVKTTKQLMQTVHDAGFNTVRIPVTWGNMIDDANGYAIKDAWLTRVQEIVDYAVAQDMYVIINIHHDGAEQTGWLRLATEDRESLYEKFAGVWANIAERFRDYDEHLIFESMNEVTGGDDSKTGVLRDMEVIMELNQIFVDTVRATGSNNTQRWLSVPARYTNINNTCKDEYGFTMPEDRVKHLFLSVHYYDWQFGLQENLGVTTWTLDKAKSLENEVKQLEKFTSQGYPVIMGEYGAVNKNNTEERTYHYEVVNRLCKTYGIVPCVWDMGWYDDTREPVDYSFTLFDRTTMEHRYPSVTDAIMRGMYTVSKGGIAAVTKPQKVTELTDFVVPEELVLTAGEHRTLEIAKTPENSNDVILWKTADDSVATVSNGHVHAKGIGTTVLTAVAQSGSVTKTIAVTVHAQESDQPVTKIKTASGVMTVNTGKSVNLEAEMVPEQTDAFLTYRSSNPKIATVNEEGQVFGIGAGTAYVFVTASTGLTKSVKIKVSEVSDSGNLEVALNVYYNDSTHSYFGNDYGTPVSITGPGQYTVVFDSATDFSAAAKAAGVTGLTGSGAIYIKDHAVTLSEATKTAATSFAFRYDRIVIDGTELTITDTAVREGIKASGVLDTGDPLNAWDGSAVSEVTADNYVLNFGTITDPKRMEVTFTVTELLFETTKAEESIAVKTLKAASEETIRLAVGETAELRIQVDPEQTTEKIAFLAADASVVAVNSTAVAPEQGIAVMTVTAVKTGETTVTAMGEGSAKAKITIIVE